MKNILLIFLLGCLLLNCSEDHSLGYEDGIYCANVEYYYSKTGTRSSYILEVEIQNNQLVKILWPNGGWLDDSHYSPVDITDGNTEFTSDAGVDYSINIIGNSNNCNPSNTATGEGDLINDFREEQEAQQDDSRKQREEEQEDDDHRRKQRQAEDEQDDDDRHKREQQAQEDQNNSDDQKKKMNNEISIPDRHRSYLKQRSLSYPKIL